MYMCYNVPFLFGNLNPFFFFFFFFFFLRIEFGTCREFTIILCNNLNIYTCILIYIGIPNYGFWSYCGRKRVAREQ